MSGWWPLARLFTDATDLPLHQLSRHEREFLMKTTSKVLGLVVLALVATLAQAGPARAPATPHIAINPQPLPPHHVDSGVRIAINPQPLPPRGSDTALHNASSKPYIGETEKNWR